MSEIITVGPDLATNVLQAHGTEASGRTAARREVVCAHPWTQITATNFWAQLPNIPAKVLPALQRAVLKTSF